MIISLIIFGICPCLTMAITEIKSNLYFSENPITFDPPLIKKNNHVYVPIRALTHYFNGTIRQSKRDYMYTITIQKTSFNIKPNQVRYTANTLPNTFKIPPFNYKTRLYVPLDPILQHLGYQLTRKNGHFYASLAQTSRVYAPSPPSFKSTPSLPLKPARISHHIRQIYLPISKKKYPLDIINKGGTQYVNLRHFLSFLGYSTSIIQNRVLLKKNNTIYAFKNGENTVRISFNNQIIDRKLNHTPRIINRMFYVQLHPFLNDLGFDYIEKGSQLVILKKIHSIKSVPPHDVIIQKNSRILFRKGIPLSSPHRIYWDFKFTKCPNSPDLIWPSPIKKVILGQNNLDCRMVIYLNSPQKVTQQTISPTKTGLVFSPLNEKHRAPSKKIANQSALYGKLIIIDPGHGGRDPGAVNHKNDYEKYYTLDIAKRIKRELRLKGAKAVLLRTNDTNPSLYQRVRKINKLKGDFMVSVHVNSFINQHANGTETYYYKAKEKKAAKAIQRQMVRHLGLKNNGIKHARMYVLKNTHVPGVLIEPCFMTHPKEYQQLKKPSFRTKIAKATVLGIEDYFKTK
ncbi:MAG: N-acetylmuramoyl-L-alanine amidase [Candidatus Marinamargulisbacteria bacterium]